MTTQAKVGAFTLIGLGLLSFILVQLSDFQIFKAKDYTLHVLFREVVGVNPSAEVRFAGVLVGKVFSVQTDGMGARVTIKVQPDIKIPKGSNIAVSSSGFLGEKFIGISPIHDTKEYYQDGDIVQGIEEQTMDNVMMNMNQVIDQVHDLLTAMNGIIANPELKTSLVDTTKNIKAMTDVFARVAMNNEQDMQNMIRNMNAITNALKQTTEEVDKLTKKFSNDGQSGEELRKTVENLSRASESVKNMTQVLESVVTDPKTAENLKETLENARQVSERANQILGGAGEMKTKAHLEGMHSGIEDKTRVNAGLSLQFNEKKFLNLGLESIGDGNKFNAQVGQNFSKNFAGRVGMIAGDVGLGLDGYLGSRWKLSADVYDPDDVRLRARLQYRIFDNTHIFSQVNDLNNRHDRATYVGIRQEF